MAKKKMIKKENGGDKCNICGMSCNGCKCKTWRIAVGIVALILGITLWYNWLDLQQTIAIILVLIGIKKIVKSTMKC